MIELSSRRVVQNNQSLRFTLPKVWAENLRVTKGTVLRPFWNQETGELIIRKEESK